MWDYDGLIGKAQVYFKRAEAVAQADDDAFAVWLLLGLEFLLRAPLARVHPALLADPNGDAIMHAAGYPGGLDAKEPKSIQATTVISRLRRIIQDFTSDREDDATLLTGLRNRELHTSEAALASIDAALWLPRFTRVAQVICTHLGLDPTDVVGDEVMEQGRVLVDAEDKKLAHEVFIRIATAKAFSEHLIDTEVNDRYNSAQPARGGGAQLVDCPACGLQVAIELESIRTTNERLDEGEILRDVIFIAKGLDCPVCGLELRSTAEMKAAGLPQQYTRTETESFEDRYMSSYEPDDYGND
jgi:hypothetical protein